MAAKGWIKANGVWVKRRSNVGRLEIQERKNNKKGIINFRGKRECNVGGVYLGQRLDRIISLLEQLVSKNPVVWIYSTPAPAWQPSGPVWTGSPYVAGGTTTAQSGNIFRPGR